MLTILFSILMFVIFGKLFFFALRACWGVGRILFTVILLPLFLIILVAGGLIYIALPILVVIGIVSLLCGER